ncbi:MAG: hypothetical protein HYW57_02340 [Ignavibacteriales bacterium]|nr:hypothetical protein [Ignavibacteriales bacterium]
MAKNVRHPIARRRLVVIFLIAVMLPSLFLSYLGLKSIEQEKLWQQQLVLQNLTNSLSLAIDRIETNVENQLRTFFASLPLDPTTLTPEYLYSLQRQFDHNSPVEQIFLLDKSFELVFPRTFRVHHKPLVHDKRRLGVETRKYFQAGESFETRGEYDAAIAAYQKGMTTKLSSQDRSILLIRIARCEFKKGDFPSARQTYQQILNEDRQRFYGEEIPYSVVAYAQLVAISEGLDSPPTRVRLLSDFQEVLLRNFHKLDRSQFEYYRDLVKTKLSAIVDKFQQVSARNLRKLQTLETQLEDELSQSLLLQSHVIPPTQRNFSSAQLTDKIVYAAYEMSDTMWHLAFESRNSLEHSDRIIGVKIRTSWLHDSIEGVLELSRGGEDTDFALVTRHLEKQAAERSAEDILLSAPFRNLETLLPGHNVVVVAFGENPLERIAGKSLMIYYILTVSIVLLIVVGIVFIFRDISREQHVSKMKSEFIANVSHEIKTPVATIRTLAENLNEGWVAEQKKQEEYFHLIARETERLSHLVENILDFSRIEAKRKSYQKQMTSGGDLIHKTLEQFRLLTDGQGVKLRERIPPNLPRINVDPEAIEQALLNLFDNAVKYSREEKLVEVSTEVTANYLRVKVSDHGHGIEKRDLEKIFEKFYRIDSRNGKKIPGSGIGLTLVKEIIEAHGGKVTVESELDKGSTFVLSIPLEGA